MSQLQRPSHVFMQGDLVPWDSASIHITSEALIRATSVFEGIKGYWQEGGDVFSLLALRQHYDRLCRSAKLLELPFEMGAEEFQKACARLVQELLVPERDLWLRPTLMAVEGNWGVDTVTDLVITAYTLDMSRPDPIALGLSPWQRPGDRSQPARIKSSANYQVGRLARMEGRRRGYDEVILFNSEGRVAETTGSCVLIVRDGTVITPPPSESCLESITVDIIEAMSAQLAIPFVRRPIDSSELFVADEIFIAGTLSELVPVASFEGAALPAAAPVTARLADLFWEVVRGRRSLPGVELTKV